MQSVILFLIAVGLIAVACGGDSDPQPTGTAASQRVERQATVSEQTQQEAGTQQSQPTQEAQAAQAQPSSQPDQAAAQDQPTSEQAESENAPTQDDAQDEQPTIQEDEPPQLEDEQAVAMPEDIVGEHKGLRSERNVLGDPDAPVEIRYFGDFT